MGKMTSEKLFILFCLQLALSLAFAATIKVNIDTSKPIFKVSERFVSVTLDQNNLVKKPAFGPLDFNLPRVKTLLKGLSPAWLRFGGTTTDSVIFSDIKKDIFDATGVVPYFQTITVAEFDNLAKACYDNGLRLFYEFNLQTRYGEQWDPTNALYLLEFIAKQKYANNVDFELGNEPNHYGEHPGWVSLNGSRIASDYAILKRLLVKLNFKFASLVGPDMSPFGLFKDFLDSAANIISAATLHHYYFGGPGSNTSDYTNPKHFIEYEDEVQMAKKAISATSRPDLPLWNGETSDAYNNGTKHVSDRYVSGFLWLDKLGVSARMEMGVVMRQTFFGGNYGLVNDSMLPNPDYWLSYLHKKLVGRLVLNVTLNEKLVKGPASTVRGYAHCSSDIKGGVVFYALSVDKNPANFQFDASLGTDANVYWLTPEDGNLLSQTVLLNGEPLNLIGDSLPPLKPRQIDVSQGFIIPALTFGFIVFPNANVKACE